MAEAPSGPLAALVRGVGAVDAAELVRRGAVGPELDRVTSARREVDSAAADLDRIGRLGGRLVTPDDPDWPFAPFAHFAGVDVRDHPDGIAPLALWVIGAASLSTVSGRAAAVVGTRAATAYGEHVAAELAAGLCRPRRRCRVGRRVRHRWRRAHRAALAVDGSPSTAGKR